MLKFIPAALGSTHPHGLLYMGRRIFGFIVQSGKMVYFSKTIQYNYRTNYNKPEPIHQLKVFETLLINW